MTIRKCEEHNHWFSNKISSNSDKNGFVDIFGFVFNAICQQLVVVLQNLFKNL